MEYVSLDGNELSNDVGMIEAALEENPEAVFIFTHTETKLFAYIDCLVNEGLDNHYLYKLKICYENQGINITYTDENHLQGCNITSISQLVKILDKNIPCRIIVNDDRRNTLANIVQQLVYIAYPVSSVDILLKSEADNEDKIQRFTEKIDGLSLTMEQAANQFGVLREKYSQLSGTVTRKEQEEFFKKIDSANKSFGRVKTELGRIQSSELKIGIAASGNTGKSTIINSIPRDNNCNYTIFDMPGPDAGAEDINNSILKTIPRCDIVVFAIDFTRYLNAGEEEFLRKIKETGKKRGKPVPVVFAINKIDELYSEASITKSIIQSIDFIQNRLYEINQDYNQCIIFAISALQYLNTIECEKGCGEFFTGSDDLYSDISFLEKKWPEYNSQLAWLEEQIGNLDSFQSASNVNPEMLKQYSGIPGLLDYVSYVARTRAREDILNNVTVIIDQQMKQLQSLTDYVANIEKLASLNDEKIKSIGSIINSFKSITGEILDNKITKADLSQLQKPGKIGSYIGEAEEAAGFGAIKKGVRDEIENSKECLDSDLKMAAAFFKKIQDKTYKDLTARVKEKTIDGRIEKSKLDNILSNLITSDLLKTTANEIIKDYYNKAMLEEQQNFDNIKSEIEIIIAKRTEQIENAMKYCKKQLEKDAQFNTPDMPDFSFCIPGIKDEIKVRTVEAGIEIKNNLYILQDQVAGKRMNKLRQAWRNLLDGQRGRVEYYVKEILEADYDTCFKEKFYAPVCDTANDIGFQQRVRSGLDGISAGLGDIIDNFYKQFSGMADMCRDSIEAFTAVIDDREQFRSNNEDLEKQKELIKEISLAIEEFSEL